MSEYFSNFPKILYDIEGRNQRNPSFTTAANLPGVTLGESTYPTPMADMFVAGDKLTFETLNVTLFCSERLVAFSVIIGCIIESK